MNATIPQLQLFALLTALEHDLREIIREYFVNGIELRYLIEIHVLEKCIDRFNKDRGISEGSIEPLHIINYLDIGEAIHCVNKNISKLPASLQQHFKQFQQQLQGVVPTRNRVMHGRPLEFDDY